MDKTTKKTCTTKLRIIYWNARSAVNKKEEIEFIIKNIDILIIVESWLNEFDTFVFSGFNTLRKDRLYGCGGGIVFLIRKSYNYIEISNIANPNNIVELCGVKITNMEKPVSLIACYKPPDVNLTIQEWDLLLSNTRNDNRCLLVGDFNSSNEAWNCTTTDANGRKLYDSIINHDLYLHNNNTHTRIDLTRNQKSNIDLVFSSMDISQFISVTVSNDSLGSDHYPININIDAEKYYYQTKTFKIQTKKTDWCNFARLLDEEYNKFLTSEYDSLPPTDKYNRFVNSITETLALCTPKKRKVSQKKYRNPVPWWDEDCSRILRLRQAAYKKYEFSNNISDLVNYKKMRSMAKKLIKNKKRESFKQFAETLNFNSNIKYTWDKARILKNKWCKVKEFSTSDFTGNSTKIEDALRNLCPDWVPSNPNYLPATTINTFFDYPFNYTEFNVALNSRGNKSAPGIDCINYEVLHNCPIKFQLLLLDILNELFTHNIYPDSWRDTFIHFVEKPNGKGLRPLALTSCICKIFELLVSNRLRWWVEHNNILPVSQTGFRKGFSCADNLTTLKLDIDIALKNNNHVHAAFLDVSNAFNHVQCEILLTKLSDIGCSTKIVEFIKFITYQRKIFTEYNLDDPQYIYKGVPQGGVLSPILYLIYVKDLANELPEDVKILQFADDIVIYTTTKDSNKAKNSLELAITNIRIKLSNIGLTLSPAKTEYIHFNKDGIEPGQSLINVKDQVVLSKGDVKFLGVYFDYRLTFDKHVRCVQEKTNRALNIVKFLSGVGWGAHPSTLLTFYKSFVRSIIDYGSFIYLPSQKTKLMKIEKVQYAAIRVALGLRRSTPTNILLGESKLLSIFCRAKILCTNFLLKLYNNARSIAYLTIKTHSKTIIRDHRKTTNILYECIKSVIGINHLITTVQLPGIYKHDYNIIKCPVIVNMEIGRTLQSAPNANDLFVDTFKYQNSINIFTDGSKTENSLSVGCACICQELNVTKTKSVINKASIFTAESMALVDALDVAIANKDRNVNIFTDSLSAAQALSASKTDVGINPFIIEARLKNYLFHCNNNSTKLTIYWIPSHRGIDGNERADILAKATTFDQPVCQTLPYTDFKPFFKKIFANESYKSIQNQGQSKGVRYFQSHYKKNPQPWFHNKNLTRKFIVTVCRCRSNHVNLKESLAKINVVPSADCDCGLYAQNLNHILWQCTLYDRQRISLMSKLSKKKYHPPHDINNYLAEPNIPVMKIIVSFLNECEIKV